MTRKCESCDEPLPDEHECPFCGEVEVPRWCLVCDDSWWDGHMTWGVRRCGTPTPEHLKKPCHMCVPDDSPNHNIHYCSCCDGTGKVNV